MKLYKFSSIVVTVTIMATCYVHQRVEIIKNGYLIQKNKKYLSSLVDQNSKLMYNLSKLESPKYLLASLDKDEIVFANDRVRRSNSYNLAQIESPGKDSDLSFISRILDRFTPKAEAKSR